MKMASVLDYLKDDNKLTTILNHKKQLPKITAYVPHDKNAYPYVVVKLEPFDTSVLIGQYRCEVRVVTDDVLQVGNLTEAVIDRLHFGNKPSVEQGNSFIYTSTHSGGTLVHDEEKDVFQQVLIFNIKFKR